MKNFEEVKERIRKNFTELNLEPNEFNLYEVEVPEDRDKDYVWVVDKHGQAESLSIYLKYEKEEIDKTIKEKLSDFVDILNQGKKGWEGKVL